MGEEENEVPDDEIINQMLARSEDEFDLFQRMDLEGRRAEADLGTERKDRLIQECGLPEFLMKDEDDLEMEELAEQQKEAELGRGNRARKEVTYQEQLSERDWLKAIGAEEDEDEEDATGAFPEETPKKKKSSKKKTRDDDDGD